MTENKIKVKWEIKLKNHKGMYKELKQKQKKIPSEKSNWHPFKIHFFCNNWYFPGSYENKKKK